MQLLPAMLGDSQLDVLLFLSAWTQAAIEQQNDLQEWREEDLEKLDTPEGLEDVLDTLGLMCEADPATKDVEGIKQSVEDTVSFLADAREMHEYDREVAMRYAQNLRRFQRLVAAAIAQEMGTAPVIRFLEREIESAKKEIAEHTPLPIIPGHEEDFQRYERRRSNMRRGNLEILEIIVRLLKDSPKV